MMKRLRDNKGETYIDVAITVMIVAFVLVFAVNMVSLVELNQNMKTMADQIADYATVQGTTDIGSFINDLRNWGNYHDRLYIWDYTTCFAHYPSPHPNWRVLQKNMQAFHRNHVKGMFEQANGAKRGGVDFCKLLWDPYCNVEKHIQEFTDYYYGAAGVYVREYLNALCDKADKENIHVGFNDQPVSKLFEESFTQNEIPITDLIISSNDVRWR